MALQPNELTPRTIATVRAAVGAALGIALAAGVLTIGSSDVPVNTVAIGTAAQATTVRVQGRVVATEYVRAPLLYGLLQGNAATASALATPRNFSISGPNTTAPPVAFDGTADVDLVVAVAELTNANIAAAAGIVDTKLATIATAGKVANSATTATALNTPSAIVARDASGNFVAGTITANLDGVADEALLADVALLANEATELETARAFSISGDGTAGPVNFDGTANVGLALTLAASQPNVTTMANLTTIGTLVAGAVPASLVTAGTFGAGAYTFPSTLNITTSALIGTTTAATGSPVLDVVGSLGLVVSDVVTNATQKVGRIASRHYTNSEEAVAALVMVNDSTNNSLRVGGGSGTLNAANTVGIYTAANNTTLTGTLRASWDGTGLFAQVGNATIGGTLGVTGAVTSNNNILFPSVGTAIGASVRAYGPSNTSGFLIANVPTGAAHIWWVNGVEQFRVAAGAITGGTYNGQTISSAASFTGTVQVASDIIVTGSTGIIRKATSDAADNQALALTGGGAVSTTRGAFAVLYGNENATANGRLLLNTGDAAAADWLAQIKGNAFLSVTRPASTNVIAITGQATFSDVLTVNSTAVIAGGSTTNALSVTTTGAITSTFRYDSSNRLDIAVSSAGAVTYDAVGASAQHTFADAVRVNAPLAFNTTPSAAIYLNVSTASLVTGATTGHGIVMQPVAQSDVTSAYNAGYFQLRTQAAAFTLTNGAGVRIASANLGAGSAVTTMYGLLVENVAAGATNYAIYTNSGLVRFGDAVTMASTLGVTGVAAVGGATLSSTTALITPASTTGVSSLRVPHGTAPSAPVNGDIWTTTSGAFARINGSTVSLGGGTGDVVGPGSATDNAIVRFDGTTGKLVQDSVVTIADTTGAILMGSGSIVRNVSGGSSEHRLQFGNPSSALFTGQKVLDMYDGASSGSRGVIGLSGGSIVRWSEFGESSVRWELGTDSSSRGSLRLRAYNGASFIDTALEITNTAGSPATWARYNIFPAATTSIPSLRIPHGTAPSSPTNGDYWTDTSSAKVRINGVTHYASWARGAAIADPAGGATVDTEARAAIAALLAHSRTVNFIAT